MQKSRVFPGFSSTDIKYFRIMQAWNSHDDIDVDFVDCQWQRSGGLKTDNEATIKRAFKARINMAGTYILLIGEDTRFKRTYVLWEAEVAIEKGCRLICMNLDDCRVINWDRCPEILKDAGAIHIPFSSRILAHTLKDFRKQDKGWFYYPDHVYTGLGYDLSGNTAKLPPPPNPFAPRKLFPAFKPTPQPKPLHSQGLTPPTTQPNPLFTKSNDPLIPAVKPLLKREDPVPALPFLELMKRVDTSPPPPPHPWLTRLLKKEEHPAFLGLMSRVETPKTPPPPPLTPPKEFEPLPLLSKMLEEAIEKDLVFDALMRRTRQLPGVP